MTDESLLDVIEMQSATMKEASAAIDDAKATILAQQSTIQHYEWTLLTILSTLDVAALSPALARELVEEAMQLARNALGQNGAEPDTSGLFAVQLLPKIEPAAQHK